MKCESLPVIIVVASALACGGRDEARLDEPPRIFESDAAELSHDSLSTTPVASSIIAMEDSLVDPHDIGVAGDILVVSALSQAPFVTVLNRHTGATLRSMGNRGSGPLEFTFRGPTILTSADTSSGSTVWLRDNIKGKFLVLSSAHDLLDMSAPVSPFATGHRISFQHSARMRGGGFLVSGYNLFGNPQEPLGYGYGELDDHGAPRTIRRPLDFNDSRIPNSTIRQAYAHAMCIRPSGNAFALAYTVAGRVDIVDIATGDQRRAATPFPFLPPISKSPTTGQPEFSQSNQDIRAAYMDCVATDQYIFATFSGRRMREFPGRAPGFCKHVHVFDWSGALVGVMALDHAAQNIAVDSDGELLYTIDVGGPDGLPVLRVTPIPDW